MAVRNLLYVDTLPLTVLRAENYYGDFIPFPEILQNHLNQRLWSLLLKPGRVSGGRWKYLFQVPINNESTEPG